MLIKGSNTTSASTKASKDGRIIVPAIPFEVLEPKKVPKGGTVKFEMKLEPTKKDSNTYEVEVKVKLFNTGTPEEWLEFLYVWEKVKTGQHLQTDVAKATVFSNMLRGEALHVFEDQRSQVTLTYDLALFDGLVQEVTRYFFP
jgi:hypothetical protein